jgi:hypothetical protein
VAEHDVTITVSTEHYQLGSTQFYWGNHRVVDAVTRLAVALGGASGMAGSDTGGDEFARQYDAASGPLVRAGADLGESMGKLANLLNTSLINHQGADYGARIAGPPIGEIDTGDSDPNDYTETVSPATPASARGGTGNQPGWWHWIASHMEGLVWPDADTDRLRSTGQSWLDAADVVEPAAGFAQAAASELGLVKSPEITDAVTTCNDVRDQATALGGAYRQIGQACIDYGNAVDEHHRQVEDAIADFIKWTIIIEGGSAILSEIGGEIWGQAIEAAKIASAAKKVVSILKPLVELAKGFAGAILKLVEIATSALKRFKAILSVRAVRAVEESAATIAKAEKDALLAELKAAGKKFDPDAIVTIFRDSQGRIVWLEKGDADRGLAHILGEHGGEFAAHGYSETEIPRLLETALQDGRIIGYQGKGLDRPIYEVMFGGKLVKIAITVGSNGYIVGANLR